MLPSTETNIYSLQAGCEDSVHMNSEISEEPAHSGTYRLNCSPSLVPYPLAWMCIVWDRDFVYFHLLNYLLNWVFHSKQPEISMCIFSKQDCAEEIPAVWPGIVGITAIIDAASSLELAGQGKDFIVVCQVFFLLNIATF